METTTKAIPQAVEKALEAKLEAMKADPCKITPEALETLLEPAREANTVLNEAMAAYEGDLATRRAALDKQAENLDAKIKTLKAQISALESQSREAASRGDLDAAANLDEQAEGLRKQLSTASRKRRIATSTTCYNVELSKLLIGDNDLNQTIRSAVEILQANGESWNDTLLIGYADGSGSYAFTGNPDSESDQKAIAAVKEAMGLQQYATADDLFFAIDPEGWANVMTMKNRVGSLVQSWNGLVASNY